jgi:RNA polymerase subunit RPABC4/transcription elongation factor Spt4
LEEVVARVLQLFLALTGAYALALWFALVVWTYRDITARSNNMATHIFSTLVVVLFFVPGAIIYLILRPRETLDEVFQRTMEEEYLLQDLDDFPVCPACRRSVRDDFLYCPHCRTQLRHSCVACHRLVDVRWEACPYCAAPQVEPIGQAVTPEIEEPKRRWIGQRSRSGNLQAIDGGKANEMPVEVPSERRQRSDWDNDDYFGPLGERREPAAETLNLDAVSDQDRDRSQPSPPRDRAARDRG